MIFSKKSVCRLYLHFDVHEMALMNSIFFQHNDSFHCYYRFVVYISCESVSEMHSTLKATTLLGPDEWVKLGILRAAETLRRSKIFHASLN